MRAVFAEAQRRTSTFENKGNPEHRSPTSKAPSGLGKRLRSPLLLALQLHFFWRQLYFKVANLMSCTCGIVLRQGYVIL